MDTIICGLTTEQRAQLKATHGYIFEVTVQDGEQEFKAICKEPTMEAMEASAAIGKESDLKGSMILFDNCMLACDDDIKKRFLLKVQVIKAIGERINGLSVTTKNL